MSLPSTELRKIREDQQIKSERDGLFNYVAQQYGVDLHDLYDYWAKENVGTNIYYINKRNLKIKL